MLAGKGLDDVVSIMFVPSRCAARAVAGQELLKCSSLDNLMIHVFAGT
jgi:hypothetical protein